MPNQHLYINGERFYVPRGLFPDRSNHPEADQDRCRELSPQAKQCTRRLGHAGGHVVGTGNGGGWLTDLWRPGVWLNEYVSRNTRTIRRERVLINGMLQRISTEAGEWRDTTENRDGRGMGGVQCGVQSPGVVMVACSRSRGHEGNHVYGNGEIIRAVWKYHMRPGERAPFRDEGDASPAVGEARPRSAERQVIPGGWEGFDLTRPVLVTDTSQEWEQELARPAPEPQVRTRSYPQDSAEGFPYREPYCPPALTGLEREIWLRSERAARLRIPRARRLRMERQDDVARYNEQQEHARQIARDQEAYLTGSRLP